MSEVMTMPGKCRFEDVFDANFVELIRLVPCNPFVRALILKLTAKLPPADCETFEQLKEWVETNCEKRARAAVKRSSGEDGISISVEFSETEYGRADYSVPRWGTEQFHVEADDLMEIVREAVESGGGIDEVVDMVAGKIDDDAWNQCEPDMDNYGDYDYSDHESNDSGDGATEYSRDHIRDAVLRFVRERHPELADEL
ncbi:MAG: hypothetical protein NTZ16_11010 [Verrucomicrobia bacterium]|nr:hypothetical protein [Verrucomicrobiota bacterium]